MRIPRKPEFRRVRFEREAAFSDQLSALQSDRRNVALLNITVTFAVMAGLIIILALDPGPWSYVLAFVGIGLMQYRIVIACHEAVHKALLYPLWLNEIVGGVHCALVGINLLKYRYEHMAHHSAQDVGHDPDAYIYEPILQSRPGLRRLAVLIFGVPFEVVEKLRHKGFIADAPRNGEAMVRFYSLAIVAFQAALLVASALWFSWWYYFAFWLAPLLTIAVFINRTRVFVEHGYPHMYRAEGSGLSAAPVEAIDVSVGTIEGFFIAPYRMNYHYSHHRLPSIPFHRNPDLSRLLEERGDIRPATIRPTYAQALQHLLWN